MQKMTKEDVAANLQVLLKRYQKEEQEFLDLLSKEDREAIGHPLKAVSQLDRFTANGVLYIVRTSLALARFEQFEKLQTSVAYGVDNRQMFANMRKAFDYLNESQPADASVILYNAMNGIKTNLDGRENAVLSLCTLFISREDEDLAKYDIELNKAKLQDWREEGIEAESFFTFAFNLVNAFTPVYEGVSRNISEHQVKAQDVLKRKGKKKSTPTKQ